MLKMSDAEDNTKTVDRESKDSKDKVKEDGDHLDNQVGSKAEDGKDEAGKNKEKVTSNKKNAKTNNQKKEEEEEDDDDEEEEDSDEDDDNDGKVPLLDQPLQISGTRDRKKVERFAVELKVLHKDSPKNEIPEGRGTQLGEIPRIEANIQKTTIEKLKPLHKLLFKSPGKPQTLKKNIRKFNGFDFKEGSDLYNRKRATILKLDLPTLKDISRNLDLTTGGSREEIVNRILEFLLEPKDSEKPLKNSKKKRASTSSTKKPKRQKTNASKGKKKAKDSDDEISSDAEEETKENNDKESSEEEEEEKESEEEKDESDEDSKKKKPAKKKPTANTKKPAPKKAEPKKEAESKKAETKTAEKKRRKGAESSKSDEDSSEDEPLIKKAKQPPTDDEIKSYVKQILDGANLEEITMKTVCKQVYAAYPEFDLAHKKDFIKTTVKSLIST